MKSVHMPKSEHQEKFRRGVEQFNTRRFFEAHETWEEIWLASPEPEKTFLQGIIQIAAAFHHYSRGNTQGTRTLLEAGLRRLEGFPAVHNDLALEALRAAARNWADMLTHGRDPGAAHVPTIAYAPNE
jgi:predicted metal-dependent hydrolase